MLFDIQATYKSIKVLSGKYEYHPTEASVSGKIRNPDKADFSLSSLRHGVFFSQGQLGQVRSSATLEIWGLDHHFWWIKSAPQEPLLCAVPKN